LLWWLLLLSAGDFIEEDDGEYGADMGEEDDFFNGDGNLSGKKRKDGAGKGVLTLTHFQHNTAAAPHMQRMRGCSMPAASGRLQMAITLAAALELPVSPILASKCFGYRPQVCLPPRVCLMCRCVCC
jgi:hypothetical protein